MSINPTLRQLEVFLAVARTLSFSKAAQLVHLSQPALSSAVRKLEDVVGTRLFDRNTRNVILTPAGAELRAIAEAMLNDFDFALSRIHDYLDAKRGRISIAVAPSVAAAFLPQVIAAFRRAYPGIAMELHDTFSERCIDLVRDGKVDLALASQIRVDPNLSHVDLFRDRLVLCCGANHPLTRRRTVTWRQLAPFDRISVRGPSSVRYYVDAAYARAHVPLRPVFEVENASTALGLISRSLAVTVLPHLMLHQFKLGPLVYRRIVGPEIFRDICAITLKSRSLAPAAEEFIKTCLEQAQLGVPAREPARVIKRRSSTSRPPPQ